MNGRWWGDAPEASSSPFKHTTPGFIASSPPLSSISDPVPCQAGLHECNWEDKVLPSLMLSPDTTPTRRLRLTVTLPKEWCHVWSIPLEKIHVLHHPFSYCGSFFQSICLYWRPCGGMSVHYTIIGRKLSDNQNDRLKTAVPTIDTVGFSCTGQTLHDVTCLAGHSLGPARAIAGALIY